MHPLRFRIVTEFLGGRELAPGDVAAAMPDVPQATLYRHFNRLVEAGILVQAGERRGRGAVERRYHLDESARYLPEDEVRSMSAPLAQQYFGTFAGSLLGDFERYTAQPFLLRDDGTRFRKLRLHCNDDEYAEFRARLDALVGEYERLSPREDRRARIFSDICIPEPLHPQERPR